LNQPADVPILNLARAMPMVRTILPPIEFCWWPNTCSTRARTLERVVFADFWRSDSGRFHAARRGIRLCKPFAFRPASICSER
jgi:hypothetical protein